MTRAISVRQFDAPEESALVAAYQGHLCPETLDQRDSFPAHPIRHKNVHRISERPADRRERYPRIPTRRFRDRVAWADGPVPVGAFQDMKRHPVLYAARKVQVFRLGENGAALAIEVTVDREQRSVAYQVLDILGSDLPGAESALKVGKVLGVHL